ncbi:MAG: hypothetical protein U0527_08225 [Candidatus Eisenbacteria bacterium]
MTRSLLLLALVLPLLLPDGSAEGQGHSSPQPASIELHAPLRTPEGVQPSRLARDGLARLFVLDRSETRLLRLEPDGSWRTFGLAEQGGERLARLGAIYGARGSDLFALDGRDGTLYRFDLDGHWRAALTYGGDASSLGLVDPIDFALTKSGELVVLDRAGGRLLFFDRFGRFVTDLAAGAPDGPLLAPTRIALDAEDDLYVLDPPAHLVRRFSRQGAPLPAWSFDRGLAPNLGRGELLDLLPDRIVAVAAADGSWLRLFDAEGSLLLESELDSLAGTRAGDLLALDDTLLCLARPSLGEVARLVLRYAQDADSIGR